MWKEGERGEEIERKGKKDLLWKNCKDSVIAGVE